MHQEYSSETVAEERTRAKKAQKEKLQDEKQALETRITNLVADSSASKRQRAYDLAKALSDYESLFGSPQSLLGTFDAVDFIFCHTHYDEMSNWFFFRRS